MGRGRTRGAAWLAALALTGLALSAGCGQILGLVDNPIGEPDGSAGDSSMMNDGQNVGSDSATTDGQTGTDAGDADADVYSDADADVNEADVDADCGDAAGDDPNNCGACGRICANCSAGMCPIVTVSAPETYPASVVSDDTYVYWAGGPGIRRAPVSATGGGAKTLVTSPVGGVAFDDSSLYWTNSGAGSVYTSFKDGGGYHVMGTTDYPAGISAHAGYAYWTDWAGTAHLWRAMPIADGGHGEDLALPAALPGSLVTDATSLYWIETGSGSVASCPGNVIRKSPLAGLGGGAGQTIVASNVSYPAGPANTVAPGGLGLDATNIYWASCDSSIWVAKKSDGSGARKLIDADPQGFLPVGIASDGVHLYWETFDGKIMRAKTNGTEKLVLADLKWDDAATQTFTGFFVDANWVYWVEYGGAGSVKAVAK